MTGSNRLWSGADERYPAVWVDGCAFENPHQVGVWRVFYETMRRAAGRVRYTLWLRGPARQPLPPGVPVLRDNVRYHNSIFNPIGYARGLAAERSGPGRLRAADVFHSTFFTRCPVPGPARVVTVYDMIAERLGAEFAAQARQKRPAIASADVCLCISAATAADLTAYFPAARRVRVAHLGCEHLAVSSAPAGAVAGSAALYVGHRGSYKNFAVVLRAAALPSWPAGVPLDVAGLRFAAAERAAVAEAGVGDRIRHRGRLSDADLARAYRSAACLIYPSLLEGFGLPILEAQANGCPVVLSDIPVFREVAGDAGFFFDPRDPSALGHAVAEVMRPVVRARLVDAGRANVGRFSWDAAAEQIVAAYREASELRLHDG